MGTSELTFCRSEQVQHAEEQESGDETPAAAADAEPVQQATATKPKSAAAFKPRPAKSNTRPRARVNTKSDHSKKKATTK